MRCYYNDSLKTFAELIRKDITGLCYLFSTMKPEHGNLLVDGLLLEVPIDSNGYARIDTMVKHMEWLLSFHKFLDWESVTKALLAHRRTKEKYSSHQVLGKDSIYDVVGYVAGCGNLERGRWLCRAPKRVHLITNWVSTPTFIQGCPEGDAVAKLLDQYNGSHRARTSNRLFLRTGFRTDRDVQEFRDLCSKVFINGERTRHVIDGKNKEARELYRKVLTGRPYQVVESIKPLLTKLQKVVLHYCFGAEDKDITKDVPAWVAKTVDATVNSLPGVMYNLLNPNSTPMQVIVPAEARQVTAMLYLLEQKVVVLPSDTYITSSVKISRYATSEVAIHGNQNNVDLTAGVLGRELMLADTAINYVCTLEDLKASAWMLSPKDLVLIKLYHLDKMKQRDIAAKFGITQGATSHRLIAARIRIRLFADMGRFPTDKELKSFVKTYLPESIKAFKVLSASVKSRGNQSFTAELLDIGQPAVGTALRTWHKRVGAMRISPEHYLAWKYLDAVVRFPYAFQDVHTTYVWDLKELNEQLTQLSLKGII